MEMKRLGFHEKNIIACGYDPVDGILAVQFKSGVYKYSGVPEVKYVNLCKVPYPDGYYTKQIKGIYPVISRPEKKVKDGESSNVQNAPRRVCDGNAVGANCYQASNTSEQPGHSKECGRSVLQDGRRDVSSTGSRPVMELFRAQEGLTFVEEGHRYELQGKRLISLTQILDAAGLIYYPPEAETAVKAKAPFGQKVHQYCLWLDQNELDMDDLNPYPNYFNRVEGWRQFCEDFNFVCEMQWCEVPCAVKVNGITFAMTIDRFGFTGPAADTVPTVVEIKTCCDREYSHQIQTAAQTIPFRGDGSVPVKRYAVYLLDKPNGSGRNYFCQEHTERTDEKVFLAALMLTQTRINNKLLKGY
jgi:hypothetical protein